MTVLTEDMARMTAQGFVDALDTIGWSQRHLSELLGCDTNLPTRWARGAVPVPPAIAAWLGELRQAHLQNPPPPSAAWRLRQRSAA